VTRAVTHHNHTRHRQWTETKLQKRQQGCKCHRYIVLTIKGGHHESITRVSSFPADARDMTSCGAMSCVLSTLYSPRRQASLAFLQCQLCQRKCHVLVLDTEHWMQREPPVSQTGCTSIGKIGREDYPKHSNASKVLKVSTPFCLSTFSGSIMP
jgi:hypothetical protein